MKNIVVIKQIKENGYFLCNSSLIVNNQKNFILDCLDAHKRFDTHVSYNNIDSTKSYAYYNIFSLTVGSNLFFQLYKQLCEIIRTIANDDRPLWMKCWLNYHNPHQVLKRHIHKGSWFHGYVSIDPKNTSTVFDDFEIKNEIGNIYVGPSLKHHEVKIHENYDGFRLTLGFDVVDEINTNEAKNKGIFDVNLSFIPVL